jgi:hypothetical protein
VKSLRALAAEPGSEQRHKVVAFHDANPAAPLRAAMRDDFATFFKTVHVHTTFAPEECSR